MGLRGKLPSHWNEPWAALDGHIGQAALVLNQPLDAEAAFQRALAETTDPPRHAVLLTGLASATAALGEPERACAAAAAALDIAAQTSALDIAAQTSALRADRVRSPPAP